MARGSDNGSRHLKPPRPRGDGSGSSELETPIDLEPERDIALRLVRALWNENYGTYSECDRELASSLGRRQLPDAAIIVVGGLLIHEAEDRLARLYRLEAHRVRALLAENQRKAFDSLDKPPHFR